MRDNRNAYTVLVVTPEGTKPLGIPRYGWEGKIKMCLRNKIGGCGLELSGSEYGPPS